MIVGEPGECSREAVWGPKWSASPVFCSPVRAMPGAQIAAAFLEEIADDVVRVQSTGPAPCERMNPLVVQVKAESVSTCPGVRRSS
ncbi:hypothetical protein [Streptomyces cyaneofuscatus]|uniref:hypothetical protein n=1 Tax=Streptomyces cyaneofuscatus TaxID=66883 RepID=UPI0037B6C8D6